MSKNAVAVLVTIGLCVVGVTGDYLLKRASSRSTPLGNAWFVAGFIVYSSTAIGWVYVMRHLRLATIGAVYAVSTVLLLTALGTIVFREGLRPTEGVGILLAIVAILLLSRHA